MQRIVLSASRRTDIPAFYMPWFMDRIEQGGFEVRHPFAKASSCVPAGVEQVHSIVFWSKNFHPFLQGGFGERLVKIGYGLFFNFTLNSSHPVLEPNVPPLDDRMDQMDRLCEVFGPHTVQWRFDPICFYRCAQGTAWHNLDRFETIAHRASRAGVRTCVTSFVDLYRKIVRRQTASSVALIDPPLKTKSELLLTMARLLGELGIELHLCCEKDILAVLPPESGIQGASCIPNVLLAKLYGDDVSLRKDSGQRASAGCGCRQSKDIGSYSFHPCRHNCLYCYANPVGTEKTAVSAAMGSSKGGLQ
jgi:hypothetical protein